MISHISITHESEIQPTNSDVPLMLFKEQLCQKRHVEFEAQDCNVNFKHTSTEISEYISHYLNFKPQTECECNSASWPLYFNAGLRLTITLIFKHCFLKAQDNLLRCLVSQFTLPLTVTLKCTITVIIISVS